MPIPLLSGDGQQCGEASRMMPTRPSRQPHHGAPVLPERFGRHHESQVLVLPSAVPLRDRNGAPAMVAIDEGARQGDGRLRGGGLRLAVGVGRRLIGDELHNWGRPARASSWCKPRRSPRTSGSTRMSAFLYITSSALYSGDVKQT